MSYNQWIGQCLGALKRFEIKTFSIFLKKKAWRNICSRLVKSNDTIKYYFRFYSHRQIYLCRPEAIPEAVFAPSLITYRDEDKVNHSNFLRCISCRWKNQQVDWVRRYLQTRLVQADIKCQKNWCISFPQIANYHRICVMLGRLNQTNKQIKKSDVRITNSYENSDEDEIPSTDLKNIQKDNAVTK